MKRDGTSDNQLLNKCFYATFTDDGVLHQKLNPQNLNEYIAVWHSSDKKWVAESGASSIASENVMFCIPTLYVSAAADSVTLCPDGSSGGTAFGHTADGHVYEYLALGVYPGSGSAARIKSVSGSASVTGLSYADLVAGCKANSVQKGHAMLCNWYQWQLYRLLVLFSMRHFNSQSRIGCGGQSSGAETTGLTDTLGPFAGSSAASVSPVHGVKAFIENPWGHNYEILGDLKYMSNGTYAFQTSMQDFSTQSGVRKIDSAPYSVSSPSLASGAISSAPETWGWGASAGGSKSTGGCDYQALPFAPRPYGAVGGSSDGVINGNAGISALNFFSGNAAEGYGGRPVFVFDL